MGCSSSVDVQHSEKLPKENGNTYEATKHVDDGRAEKNSKVDSAAKPVLQVAKDIGQRNDPDQNKATAESASNNNEHVNGSVEGIVEEETPPKPETEDQIAVEKALVELRQSLFGGTSPAAVTKATFSDSPNNTMRGIMTGDNDSKTSNESLPDHVAVIDVGTGFCKAGLMGDDIPSIVIPTVIGRHKASENNEVFIGKDAKLRGDMLEYTSPIHRGVVSNWDDVERVYDHILHMGLNLEPNDFGVALPEPPSSTRERREKLTQMMFEKFNVMQFYLGSSSALAMHALGFSTGLVVSIGHGACHAVPVVQGNAMNNAWKATNIGNEDIIKCMQARLNKQLNNKIDEDIARAIVEKTCFIDLGGQGQKGNSKQSYSMPNEVTIELHEERYSCPEKLFNTGSSEKSIVQICEDSLSAVGGEKMASDLRNNVIIVGGPSLLPNLGERLKAELSKGDKQTKVLALPKRQYASWRGASMLASLHSSKHRWLTKAQYEEHGVSIIHRKYL